MAEHGNPVQRANLLPDLGVTVDDIAAARDRIAPHVVRTPVLRSAELEACTGAPSYLKLENLQRTGSFKLRGATNRMHLLSRDERSRGLVAVSSGNHGRAVGHVARALQLDAVVCLPETVPRHKVEAIRNSGATVRITGKTYDEASAHARRLEREEGRTAIHPFDDPRIIAGQGTIGLEIAEDLPQIDTLVVPLSGGGLISGIAVAARALRPAARVIGVSMQRAPVMHESLRAGRILNLQDEPTLADALAGGLGGSNRFTFRICRDLIDETVLVSEEAIATAMRFLLLTHRLVVEGGGAVGVAAAMCGLVRSDGPMAVVVSGGNVDTALLMEIAGDADGRNFAAPDGSRSDET